MEGPGELSGIESRGTLLRRAFDPPQPCCSSTEIYQKFTKSERRKYESLFKLPRTMPLSEYKIPPKHVPPPPPPPLPQRNPVLHNNKTPRIASLAQMLNPQNSQNGGNGLKGRIFPMENTYSLLERVPTPFVFTSNEREEPHFENRLTENRESEKEKFNNNNFSPPPFTTYAVQRRLLHFDMDALVGLPAFLANSCTSNSRFYSARPGFPGMSSSARRSSTGGHGSSTSRSDFATALKKCTAPIPPVLSRKLGRVSESPLGKVKVMLRVGETSDDASGILGIDSRRKQVTLIDPGGSSGSGITPEERRVGVSAPKMFAFDGIFGDEDDQAEICAASAVELVASVVGGEDGCFVSLGSSSTGKKQTMFGKPANQKMGVVPTTISWLFKSIQEQKLKTGSRYSVRISALTVTGGSGHEVINDLLLPFANDGDQAPGGYNEPITGQGTANGGNKFNNASLLSSISEVRASSPEKAGLYFDTALESMQTDDPVRHFVFTIHLYQHTVDKNGKGAIAGRSRLHCVNLGNGSPSISVLGGLLLAVLNAQRHLPSRDSKLGAILRECLGSLTCRAVVMIHVSNAHSRYAESLAALQLGARVHRLRRSRRLKMGSVGSGNGSGGSSGGSGEEMQRPNGLLTTCGVPLNVGATISEGEPGSSDIDPSSSEQSCDTVIYLGPSIDDCTDGENPPIYLLDGENGLEVTKIQPGKVPTPASITPPKTKSPKPKSTTKHHNSQQPPGTKSDEQWVDGPKLPKYHHPSVASISSTNNHASKNVKKCETWIDGPAASRIVNHQANNFPSPKKANGSNRDSGIPTLPSVPSISSAKVQMIQQWIVNQTNSTSPLEEERLLDTSMYLMQSNNHCHHQCQYMSNHYSDPHQSDIISNSKKEDMTLEPQYKSLTVFKTCEDDDYYENYEQEDPYICNGFEFEFIEVIEPEIPVPTRDASFQVTEEDIALSFLEENPLPESDQNFTMGNDAYYFPSSVPAQLSPKSKTTPGAFQTSASNGHPHVKSLTQLLSQQHPLQSSSSPLSSSTSSVSALTERNDDHPLRVLSQESLTVRSTFSGSLPRNGDLENYWPRLSYTDPVTLTDSSQNNSSQYHHHNHGLCKNLASLSQMSLVEDDAMSGSCCLYNSTNEKPVILSPLSTLRNNIKSSEIMPLRPKTVPVPAPPVLSDESIFKIPMTPIQSKKMGQEKSSQESDAEQDAVVIPPMKLLDITPITSSVEIVNPVPKSTAPGREVGCDHNHHQVQSQLSQRLNGSSAHVQNGNLIPPRGEIQQTKSPSKSKSRKIAKFFRGRSKSPKKGGSAQSSSESGKSSGSSTVSAETKSCSSSGASSCSSANSPSAKSNSTNNNHKTFKYIQSSSLSPSPSKKPIAKAIPIVSKPTTIEFQFDLDPTSPVKETSNGLRESETRLAKK